MVDPKELFEKMDVEGLEKKISHLLSFSYTHEESKTAEELLEEVVVEFVENAYNIAKSEGLSANDLKDAMKRAIAEIRFDTTAKKMAVGTLATVGQKLNAENGNPYFHVPEYVPYVGICAGREGVRANFICDCPGEGSGFKAKMIFITSTKYIKKA
ncbi:hypothetical protein KY311_04635 [Candidatus Woesearchaeota archaeon]|nr:hypothetical protein [Candidatus Woesearchaeota archaeon]